MVRKWNESFQKSFSSNLLKISLVLLLYDRLGGARRECINNLLNFYSFCSSINQLFKSVILTPNVYDYYYYKENC